MTNSIVIKKKLKNFNKKIVVSGDKSLSIRWVLFASLASGNSKAENLLISEDVKAAIKRASETTEVAGLLDLPPPRLLGLTDKIRKCGSELPLAAFVIQQQIPVGDGHCGHQ